MDKTDKSALEDDVRTGSNNEVETSRSGNVSSDEDESFRTCDNAETGTVVNGPPELSDDSDGSDSENSSEMFLSDNNDYDSDISDPGREVGAEEEEEEDRNVETSFQRELLDYLGSLFDVSSRIRTRDARQPVTVNDEQLEEYKKLRQKVNSEMKILGIGSMQAVCSTDQSIARNLYYLLSARERGDWSSCRQCMRVIPMWTFETNDLAGLDKDVCCGDVDSDVDGTDKSEGSAVKMDVEEEAQEQSIETCGNVVEIDEVGFKDRGIAEAVSAAEQGYLDRGVQLWTEDSDNDVGVMNILRVKESHMYSDISRDQIKKDVEDYHKVKSSITQDDSVTHKVNETVITEDVRKEKMESSIFKRTFQTCNSEKTDDNLDGTRGSLKADNDASLNTSKKFKLDPGDDFKENKVNSWPILTQVARVGQRDIKTAIYGSRWSVQRLGLERRFPVHEGCVNALNFSSSGDWIASGSDDRDVVITDWQRNEPVSRFSVGHSSNIFQVRFVPGSSDLELVTCSRDRSVRYAALSSTGQFQYSRLLAKHNDACHKMDMPLDQPCLVISAGEDCRVLWSDVRGPKNSGQLCLVDKVPLYSISCNPVRSQEFCVAGKDNRVFVYDRRKPKKWVTKLCPEELEDKPRGGYHVTSVVYSGDGNSVLASYNDEDIYLLSARPEACGEGGGTTLHKYVGHRNVQTVTGVSFYGPNQEYVVSGSNDGHVLLWERDTEALVNWFLADEAGVVNVLQPHPSMPVLATSGLDHDIKLWSMLAADRVTRRAITVDDDLIDRDQESSRIDLAWRRIDAGGGGVSVIGGQAKAQRPGVAVSTTDYDNSSTDTCKLPFNLRNLQVITALNWKMRAEAYPYSFDNTLENLIFMSRRQGESQLRNLFISDSDSNESYETVPNTSAGDESGVAGSGAGAGVTTGDTRAAAADTVSQSSDHNRDGEEGAAERGSGRPDGCRSS